MRRIVSTAICLVTASISCNTTPAFVPTALPEPPAMELLPPPNSGIPAGLFTGEKSSRFVQITNGITTVDQSSKSIYSETVDSNGLPLIQPDGMPPRVGYVSRIQQSNATAWLQITSAQASATQVVVQYRMAMRRTDGLQVEGGGTWTYRFEAPKTLTYAGHLNATGFQLDGSPTNISVDESAVLTGE